MSRTSQNILRIGADNSAFKRVMKESDQLISKSKGEWKNYANVLTKELDRVNGEMTKMLKNVKSMEDVKAFRKLTSEARDLNQELSKMGGGAAGGGGGAAGGGGGLLGGLSKKLLGLFAGVSTIAIAKEAYQSRAALAGPQLQFAGLMGRGGLSRLQGQRGTAVKYGFDPMEQTQAGISLAKQTGGQGGLNSILAMSRGYGMDVGELTGAAGSFRRSGMSQEKSVTALRDTLAVAVASGMDKSRTSEFIRVTSQMTEELAQNGIGVDPKSLSKMIGSLMVGSKYFAANTQAAHAGLGAISNLLTNSSGSRFGFAAQAIQAAYRKKTGKEMTGNELRYQMSGGIGDDIGPNKTKIPQLMSGRESMAALWSGPQGLQQKTKGLSMTAAANMAGDVLGLPPKLAEHLMEALENFDKMTDKQAKNWMSKINAAQKSPETNALELMQRTLDGELVGFAAYRANVIDKLGTTIAPSVLEIRHKIAEATDYLAFMAQKAGFEKKGLVTMMGEGAGALFGPHNAGGAGSLAKLSNANLSLNKDDRSNLANTIYLQSQHGKYGNLGTIRKELQAKLDADNSDATKANTRALLDLIDQLGNADKRKQENKIHPRGFVGPVQYTPQGAND